MIHIIIRRKLHSRMGFSLAETFLAVLILAMVSSVVASAVPVAAAVYRKIVDAANAQVLLSTTMTVLRDELGTAKDVELGTVPNATQGETTLTYTTSGGGRITLRQSDNGLCRQAGDESVLLVSKAAENQNLHTVYDSVSYQNGVVTFTGLRVLKDTDQKELASVSELKIRVLTVAN